MPFGSIIEANIAINLYVKIKFVPKATDLTPENGIVKRPKPIPRKLLINFSKPTNWYFLFLNSLSN